MNILIKPRKNRYIIYAIIIALFFYDWNADFVITYQYRKSTGKNRI